MTSFCLIAAIAEGKTSSHPEWTLWLTRCNRNRLGCRYGTIVAPRKQDRRAPAFSQTFFVLPGLSTSQSSLLEPATTLCLQVHRVIRDSGLQLDEAITQYFQGLHRYLPFISRAHFEQDVSIVESTPTAGRSALNLSLCLINASSRQSRHGESGCSSRVPNRQHLYLVTKSLFAQIQVVFPPSISFLQACVLLAVYEYSEGEPDQAFVSIAGCIRMAHRLRLHLHNRTLPQPAKDLNMPPADTLGTNLHPCAHTKEAFNTWWAIVIYERYSILRSQIGYSLL